MVKIDFKNFLDVQEFEKLSLWGIVKSFILIPIYGILAIWGSLWMRIPSLVYKLIGIQGVAIAMSCYVASRGGSANIGEILGAISTFGISAAKSYFDNKQYSQQNKTQTKQKLQENTEPQIKDEPKN